MRVKYTPLGNIALGRILDNVNGFYFRSEIQSFYRSVIKAETLLSINPNLGAREPLLYDRKQEYRHLVLSRFFKIIYTIVDDTVWIVDIWDTRRAPEILVGRVK